LALDCGSRTGGADVRVVVLPSEDRVSEGGKKKDEWFKDMLLCGPVIAGFPLICAFVAVLLIYTCNPNPKFVVVYTSQDQTYAEPIFHDFTKQTGIKVRAVYDSEAVKTVGLVNRLIAEKNHPQCDLFWNNEEFRTRQLAAQNIFRETNSWAAFGYRSRRMVVAKIFPNAPQSLIELTNEIWRGRVALAYPLFGSTATHFLALRQYWGDAKWREWCRGLQRNKPFLVDGNSVAAKFVRSYEVSVGMTDSDDIAAENRDGGNLQALPINAETLLIPNTVAVIRAAPHPEAAERLFQFLQSREVIGKLIAVNAIEGATVNEVTSPTLKPDWEKLLADLDVATKELKEIFLR
jgi:iron(III) transport system substrate-binding protein